MDVKNVNWPGWEIKAELGYGSFGSVYEIQRNLHGHIERAALKVLSIPQNKREITTLQGDGYDNASIARYYEDTLNKIENEYALMADLKGHSNIVYCDDFRKVPHEDGLGWDIYLKMELLTPLKTHIRSGISNKEIISLGIDICHALTLCHKLNIIHRDIKPENIFVARDGNYKLGDFGIAKTMEGTVTGTRTGTLDYMAPEIYNNRPYHMTADIYSLGLVMYWLLNECCHPFLQRNKKPTPSEKNVANERRVSGEELPAPRHGNKELWRIVLKACAYDPKDRFQTAEEMLVELRALTGGNVGTMQDDTYNVGDVEREPLEERNSSGTIGPKFEIKSKKRLSVKHIFFASVALVVLIVAIMLNVFFAGRGKSGIPLSITEQPVSTQVVEGESAVFAIEAAGEDLTYEWHRIESYNNHPMLKLETDCGNSSSISVDEEMYLYCIVKEGNDEELKSEVVSLEFLSSVTPLEITKQPESVSVKEGDLAVVEVSAVGEELIYEWYYQEVGSDTFGIMEKYTQDIFSVKMSSIRDGWKVYCVVTDKYGNSVTTDTVLLSMLYTPLEITKQPTDVHSSDGGSVELEVVAEGKSLDYQWQYLNSSGTKWIDSMAAGNNTSNMVLKAKPEYDGLKYRCRITDIKGDEVFSDEVMVNIMYIKKQPDDVSAKAGKPATISIEAVGEGLTYEWYYQNPQSESFSKSVDVHEPSYSITMTNDRNGRKMYCMVTDKYGNSITSNTITMTMSDPAIKIETLPDTISVKDGEIAKISVTATGENLTYTWYYKNPGGSVYSKSKDVFTSTYSIIMNSNRDGRKMYCVVSDAKGNTAVSNVVTLKMEK